MASDASRLGTVVFTVTGNVTGQRATLTLKKSGTTVTVVGSYSCNSAIAGSDTAITCDTATATGGGVPNPDIEAFDTVGLTVVH